MSVDHNSKPPDPLTSPPAAAEQVTGAVGAGTWDVPFPAAGGPDQRAGGRAESLHQKSKMEKIMYYGAVGLTAFISAADGDLPGRWGADRQPPVAIQAEYQPASPVPGDVRPRARAGTCRTERRIPRSRSQSLSTLASTGPRTIPSHLRRRPPPTDGNRPRDPRPSAKLGHRTDGKLSILPGRAMERPDSRSGQVNCTFEPHRGLRCGSCRRPTRSACPIFCGRVVPRDGHGEVSEHRPSGERIRAAPSPVPGSLTSPRRWTSCWQVTRPVAASGVPCCREAPGPAIRCRVAA